MSLKGNLFRREFNKLLFDSVDLEKEIAEKYGTPIYIFSEKKLKKNIRKIVAAFRAHYPKTQIAYSVKNNMLVGVLSVIFDELDWFEITSLGELGRVEKAVAEKIKTLNFVLTNIYKPDKLIEKMISRNDEKNSDYLRNSENLIAIDSFADFKNVERIAKKLGRKPKVLVRVNPGINMAIAKTIFASATPRSKCGAIISDIQPIIDSSDDPSISSWLPERERKPLKDNAETLVLETNNSEHLELVGLHGHIGSQVANLEYYRNFSEVISRFHKLTEEKVGKKLSILDLGGGYPISYDPSIHTPSIDEIAKIISGKITEARINPELIIESGRFITGSAGLLLSKVVLTKETPGTDNIAVLDLSVYSQLLDVLVAQWNYQCELVNALPKEEQKTTTWKLVGITNDTLDQLDPKTLHYPSGRESLHRQRERRFPRELAVGDLLVIKNAGAYTTCFNSNYCGQPKPPVVLIKDDKSSKVQLIREN